MKELKCPHCGQVFQVDEARNSGETVDFKDGNSSALSD